MRLTPTMLAALKAAGAQELRRVHDPGPGRPVWPFAPSTLAALVRHGLLEVGERRNRKGVRMTVWQVTPAGRLVLNPPPRVVAEPRRLMHRARTTQLVMQGGVWTQQSMPEPELVDPPEGWSVAARDRFEGARARVSARELARKVRAA